jgi:hypothetical protein
MQKRISENQFTKRETPRNRNEPRKNTLKHTAQSRDGAGVNATGTGQGTAGQHKAESRIRKQQQQQEAAIVVVLLKSSRHLKQCHFVRALHCHITLTHCRSLSYI